jgi:hypothetical protein
MGQNQREESENALSSTYVYATLDTCDALVRTTRWGASR